MRNSTITAIGGTLGVVFLGAAGVGINHAVANAVFPAQKGEVYLQNKGYTDIEGGKRDYFNMCGEDDPARSYTATHPTSG